MYIGRILRIPGWSIRIKYLLWCPFSGDISRKTSQFKGQKTAFRIAYEEQNSFFPDKNNLVQGGVKIR